MNYNKIIIKSRSVNRELEKYLARCSFIEKIWFYLFYLVTFPMWYFLYYKPLMEKYEGFMKCKKFHNVVDCEKDCSVYPCYYFIKK